MSSKSALRKSSTSPPPPSTPRPSGLRPRPILASEAPTLPPPPAPSVTRIKLGAPVDELLYRFSVGDFDGALSAAHGLLDDEHVPVVLLPGEVIRMLKLDHREDFLLSFIDGRETLEAVIERSGMPLLDALRVFCELLEKKVVALP